MELFDEKISIVLWELKLLELIFDTTTFTTRNHPQLIQQACDYLNEAYNKNSAPVVLENLSPLTASKWLALSYFTQDDALRQILNKIVVPRADHYLKLAERKNYFEQMLYLELTTASLHNKQVLDNAWLTNLLEQLFDYLMTHEAIVYYKLNLLDFADKVSQSAILPKMTQAFISNHSKNNQAPNNFQRFPALTKLSLNNYDHAVPALLPESLFQLTHLEELHLDNNALTEIPDKIARLKKLRVLGLYGNHFDRFPLPATSLPALETLNLSKNQLREIPEDVTHLPELISLYLSNNQITHFSPTSFTKKYANLLLDYNQITEVPDSITEETTIRYDLRCNLIDDLPIECKDMLKSDRISILGNPLRTLHKKLYPALIRQLKTKRKSFSATELTSIFCWMHLHEDKKVREAADSKILQIIDGQIFKQLKGDWRYRKNPDVNKLFSFFLKYATPLKLDWKLLGVWLEKYVKKTFTSLDLFDQDLTQISLAFFQLSLFQEVQVLIISHNQLAQLPPEIVNLQKLQAINASDNNLENLPENLRLLHLKKLYISGNQFKKIPQVLEEVQTLEVLKANNNVISEGFDTLSLLPHLKELQLRANDLTHMPTALTQLQSLNILSLEANQLGKDLPKGRYALPLEISHLENLIELHLGHNELYNLPPGIGLMEKLQVLKLNDNRFTTFPIELCEIETLQELNISHNQINYIPAEIASLKKLKRFYLINNPLSIYEKKKLKSLLPHTSLFFE